MLWFLLIYKYFSDISAKHLLSATRLFSECSIEAPSTEKLVSILRSDSERACHTSLNKPLGYWPQSPLLQSEFASKDNNFFKLFKSVT